MVKIASCFSGIGGYELGLLRAIPDSKVIWQCEIDPFCQRVLKKHWPDAKLYTDITKMDTQEVERPDILAGGYPCQDISIAGKGEGIHGKNSGLWFYMLALISRIRPSIVCLENVAVHTIRGGREVVGSLAQLGYDCEWGVIRSGSAFGAPHRRARWFCIAYSYHRSKAAEIQAGRKINPLCDTRRRHETSHSLCFGRLEHTGQQEKIQSSQHKRIQREEGEQSFLSEPLHSSDKISTNAYCQRCQEQSFYSEPMESTRFPECGMCKTRRENSGNYWKEVEAPSPLCGMDDGIPNRVDRIRSLGNAIVPQCAEWIGRRIVESNLISFTK